MSDKFDDIRPYYTHEIPSAMHRITESEHFGTLASHIFPDEDYESVKNMVRNIKSTAEFQEKVMFFMCRRTAETSTTQLSSNGIDNLKKDKAYLFVSNHRDIMLDSAFLQYILFGNGLNTSEITFGSNLMQSQFVIDIGKVNKMFKVVRSSNMREFLDNSKHLSEYIRYAVTEKKVSVWIAQRNGRTKDGNDCTDQGLIKMFCMSNPKNLIESVDELNIVPLSISYEIEPCDFLKTQELYLSHGGQKYIKKSGEDLNSIITGIVQEKGHVTLNFCNQLTKEELNGDYKTPNEFHKHVAGLINNEIYRNYTLFKNNYIAHDLRSGADKYSSHYSADEKELFIRRCNHMLSVVEGDKDTTMKIFLGIYANPVDNVEKLKQ